MQIIVDMQNSLQEILFSKTVQSSSFYSSDPFICLCLLKLYKDSVEETIKENVAIGGQEWESVNQSEVSNSSVAQEGLFTVLSLCHRNVQKSLFHA